MSHAFVHRVFTFRELREETGCVACGRPAKLLRPADIGQGGATEYLTAPLPDLRVCDRCAGEQETAVGLGRLAVACALLAPLVLVVAVAFIAPFRSPIIVPLIGFGALSLSRLVIAIVRRRRADASRVLFVDGVGEEVILQVRLESAAEKDALPYRETGRELRSDGQRVAPVGPRVRATLGFIGSTLVVSAASLVGWFGAYPLLILDNPGVDATVILDGEQIEVRAGGAKMMRVGHGRHAIAIDGVPSVVDVGWGQPVLVSTSKTQCYDLHPHAFDSTAVVGPIIRFNDGPQPQRTRCPAP